MVLGLGGYMEFYQKKRKIMSDFAASPTSFIMGPIQASWSDLHVPLCLSLQVCKLLSVLGQVLIKMAMLFLGFLHYLTVEGQADATHSTLGWGYLGCCFAPFLNRLGPEFSHAIRHGFMGGLWRPPIIRRNSLLFCTHSNIFCFVSAGRLNRKLDAVCLRIFCSGCLIWFTLVCIR